VNKDPRNRNQFFPAETLETYVGAYVESLKKAVSDVSSSELDKAYAVLEESVTRGATIYVAGNGGSAAISEHLCCDFTKGTFFPDLPPFRTHSLVSNSAFFTALSNDFGYEYSFSAQLEMLAKKGDVIILISSSGNSPNILKALEKAKSMGITSIGFSGFEGGSLLQNADIKLHVPFNNYGIVEDAHQILMHTISQYFTIKRQ
jgi:phosphoheptose isomerase